MREYYQRFRESVRKGDWILLMLCLVATVFGCIVIASSTNYMGYSQFVVVQVGAAILGVFLFILISSVDIDFFSEHRLALVIFTCATLFLLVPFGQTINGNRSWIALPLLPFNIQVAEVCKIFFILILASVMSSHQNRISSPRSVGHMLVYLGLVMGLNLVLSKDTGVTLIFLFIFIGMAFAGGVSLIWFAITGGFIVVAAPLVYNYVLDGYQKLRIEVLINPNLDPMGVGPRYHTVQSLKTLTGGGMTGKGLFNGHRTQSEGTLFARHTDYIFSSIGEELGYVGCIAVLLLLFAIVGRCVYVGVKSPDYMRRLVCFGAASAMIFQILTNVGMCIGLVPVIGLTLPFISYGGSSLVSTFLMLGLVSGVHARPRSTSHERYVRPPRT